MSVFSCLFTYGCAGPLFLHGRVGLLSGCGARLLISRGRASHLEASLVAERRLSACVLWLVVAQGLIGVSLGCAGFSSCGLGLSRPSLPPVSPLMETTHGAVGRMDNEGLERHDCALRAAVFIFSIITLFELGAQEVLIDKCHLWLLLPSESLVLS